MNLNDEIVITTRTIKEDGPGTSIIVSKDMQKFYHEFSDIFMWKILDILYDVQNAIDYLPNDDEDVPKFNSFNEVYTEIESILKLIAKLKHIELSDEEAWEVEWDFVFNDSDLIK